MSSLATNLRIAFRGRVEVEEAAFNDEGGRAKKESDIGWPEGNPRGNRLTGVWFASGK